jgi:hypothetical protein
MDTARPRALGLVLALGWLGACGDDGNPSDETGSMAGTTSATSAPTTASSGSSVSESTAAPAGCGDAACGMGCTPEACPEADCSGYACSEQGECLPFYSFYCQSQLDACAQAACGAECLDPFCNDEDGGMCAPAYCNPEGACLPIGIYEMNPCEASTGSSDGSGGTSSSG